MFIYLDVFIKCLKDRIHVFFQFFPLFCVVCFTPELKYLIFIQDRGSDGWGRWTCSTLTNVFKSKFYSRDQPLYNFVFFISIFWSWSTFFHQSNISYWIFFFWCHTLLINVIWNFAYMHNCIFVNFSTNLDIHRLFHNNWCLVKTYIRQHKNCHYKICLIYINIFLFKGLHQEERSGKTWRLFEWWFLEHISSHWRGWKLILFYHVLFVMTLWTLF